MNPILLKEALTKFLLEDMQHGDVTSDTIFPADKMGKATFIAKEDGVFSGSQVLIETYKLLDERLEVYLHRSDGDRFNSGDSIASVEGPIRTILSGERVALNLIQRMSGIASKTARAVQILDNPAIKIIDTRKTLPGLRAFDKYAVTSGGGYNHRFGLYDMVMIKDNHIAFAGSIEKAVKLVRQSLGPSIKIEVETESIEQVKEAVKQAVDIIMFDNRTAEEINEMARHVPESILTEASGGINLDNLAQYREAKVDYISLGCLTHSVTALDISLVMERG